MNLWRLLRKLITDGLTTDWPIVARCVGVVLGATELGLFAVPPHTSPDPGIMSLICGLLLTPNVIDVQRKRQHSRTSEEEREEREAARKADREIIKKELEDERSKKPPPS